MFFDFSNIKADIEGISKYLGANGILLSKDDISTLESIFEQADKSIHQENECGYNDKELDFFEKRKFQYSIDEKLPLLGKMIHNFFQELNKNQMQLYNIKFFEQKNDATIFKPLLQKEIIQKEDSTDEIATYKDHPKYKDVYSVIETELIKRKNQYCKTSYAHLGDLPPDEQQEYMDKCDMTAKIILNICDKYNMNNFAEILTDVLCIETGGFVYSEENLKYSGSQFKGVMQVDLESICELYGAQESSLIDIGHNRKIKSKHKENIYQYAHKYYYSQDKTAIDELKTKYPTPRSLYEAIQNDIELGVEVGTLVLRAKIRMSKGNIEKAIRLYSGNNYTCRQQNINKNETDDAL